MKYWQLTLLKVFKLAGFQVVNNIKEARYILDVDINVHSAEKPVMEGLELHARFVNLNLVVHNIKTKKTLYSVSSSGVTPHIDESQGKQIAIKNAINKFEKKLVASLIEN